MAENIMNFLREVASVGKSIGAFGGNTALDVKRFADLQLQREKFQHQKRTESLKLLFNQMTQFYSNMPATDPKRKWLTDMMENTFYGLDPATRAAFDFTKELRPVSSEEKLYDWYVRMNPPPEPLLDETGNPLPVTLENEMYHARKAYEASKWKFNALAASFGADKAKAMYTVPTFFVVRTPEPTAEGEKAQPNLWFMDERTGQMMPIKAEALGVDLAKAKEWGWNLPMMALRGFAPTGPPITMTVRGKTLRRIPGVSLKPGSLGQPVWDEVDYGAKDEALKLPSELRDAMSFVASDIEPDEKKADPTTLNLYRILKDFEQTFKSPEEVTANLERVNRLIGMLYPDKDIKLVYDPESAKEPSAWGRLWGGVVKFENTNWGVLPNAELLTVQNEQKEVISLYKNKETDEAHDGTGREIPKAKGANDGDVIVGLRTPWTERLVRKLTRGSLTPEEREELERKAFQVLKKVGGYLAKEWQEVKDAIDALGIGEVFKILSKDMGEEKAKKLVEAWSEEYGK